MTAILGHADILDEQLTDSKHRGYLQTIRRNGRFLLRIINDILDLSKIDAGKLLIERDRVRLDQLLSDVRSLMDVCAEEKNIDFSVSFDGPGSSQQPSVSMSTNEQSSRQPRSCFLRCWHRICGDSTMSLSLIQPRRPKRCPMSNLSSRPTHPPSRSPS